MASITGATLQEQIQKAISAHGVFKFKLINMVETQTSTMTPDVVAADDRCPLGEWLYSGIDPAAKSGEHYGKVRELHSRFHQAAGEVATLAAKRRYTEALEAMESTSTFKKTSDQLVEALEAWADALDKGVSEPAGWDEPLDRGPAAGEPAGWDEPLDRGPAAGEPAGWDEPLDRGPGQGAATEPDVDETDDWTSAGGRLNGTPEAEDWRTIGRRLNQAIEGDDSETPDAGPTAEEPETNG